MPFWIPVKTTCRHCGQTLQRGDDVLMLPPAWLEPWEPMHNFREASFHRVCWESWPLRWRFVERVNATDSGYRMQSDGRWEFVGVRRG